MAPGKYVSATDFTMPDTLIDDAPISVPARPIIMPSIRVIVSCQRAGVNWPNRAAGQISLSGCVTTVELGCTAADVAHELGSVVFRLGAKAAARSGGYR